jgi:hypothetical protein
VCSIYNDYLFKPPAPPYIIPDSLLPAGALDPRSATCDRFLHASGRFRIAIPAMTIVTNISGGVLDPFALGGIK